MTITYSDRVANVRLCGFTRLLFYWKGSVYKLLYKEMLIFITLYTALSLLYRFILQDSHKRTFEHIVLYCDTFTNLIPISFVLGFYVSIVITRWWQQYMNIPWPDRAASFIMSMMHGNDDRGRMLRRSIVRYLNLASVLVFQSISPCVKKRFPTMDHLVHAGLITEEERRLFDEIPTVHHKFWVPCMWASTNIAKARQEGRITDDINLKTIIDEINLFRGNLGMLFSYDWISIPLVYTQVTTLAVYSFFVACLMGRQFLDPAKGYNGHDVDLYIPVFTVLQFFFYLGWIKVAEQLINPFGVDDDDFEINWIIDRNLQVSLVVVDEMYMRSPNLEKDKFWDDQEVDLPYTKSTLNFKMDSWMGSTADLSLTKDDMRVVQNLEPIPEIVTSHPSPNFIHSSPSVIFTSPVKRKLPYSFNINSPKVMSVETLDRIKVNPVTPDSTEGKPLLQTLLTSKMNGSYVKDWVNNHPSGGRRGSIIPRDATYIPMPKCNNHSDVHQVAETPDSEYEVPQPDFIKEWAKKMDSGDNSSQEKSPDTGAAGDGDISKVDPHELAEKLEQCLLTPEIVTSTEEQKQASYSPQTWPPETGSIANEGYPHVESFTETTWPPEKDSMTNKNYQHVETFPETTWPPESGTTTDDLYQHVENFPETTWPPEVGSLKDETYQHVENFPETAWPTTESGALTNDSYQHEDELLDSFPTNGEPPRIPEVIVDKCASHHDLSQSAEYLSSDSSQSTVSSLKQLLK